MSPPPGAIGLCGLEAGFEDYRQFVEDFADWRGAVRGDE